LQYFWGWSCHAREIHCDENSCFLKIYIFRQPAVGISTLWWTGC
jgi:hypothetical protein